MTGSGSSAPLLKAALRATIRSRFQHLTPEERRSGSLAAAAILVEQKPWREAASVLFYAPLQQEVDLSPLIPRALEEGKLVALPRFALEQGVYLAARVEDQALLQKGRFGILEPPPDSSPVLLNQLDLLLVPGIAFDLNGRRIGRGKGFYDRMLAHARGFKCGVAFDLQVETEVPAESHDVAVDSLVTPTRWLSFDRNSVLT